MSIVLYFCIGLVIMYAILAIISHYRVKAYRKKQEQDAIKEQFGNIEEFKSIHQLESEQHKVKGE